MQTNMEFMQNDHPQGRLPLGMELTAPVLREKKRSNVMQTKYAYSIKTSRVKEPDFPYSGKSFTCTSELIDFARSLQDSDIEKMLTLYLDAQNQLICIQVASGTVNQAVVYPREIIRHALLVGASAIILMHNHPSGHTRPSDADIRLTKTIQEIARMLELLIHDHIIIGSEGRFFSFREEGLM
jgi:DNA repair protein RadC